MLRILPLRTLLTIAATVALGVGAAVFVHSEVRGPADQNVALAAAGGLSASHGQISSNGRARVLLDAPACSTKAGPVSATISITLNDVAPYFGQSCYYAPANQALTIHFTNTILNLADNSPSSLTLVVSPSQNPYRVPVPDRPGWATSSSANASFMASPVTAPDTGTFSVSPLATGTYDLQIDELGLGAIATLVVQ